MARLSATVVEDALSTYGYAFRRTDNGQVQAWVEAVIINPNIPVGEHGHTSDASDWESVPMTKRELEQWLGIM